MVSVGVSKQGKTSIHFVQPGVKVDGRYYRDTLLAEMIPEMDDLADGHDYVFQQDGARAHTAKDTVQYLKENVPELIEPEMWPANSPDLNPVDYGVWENLSSRVYREKIADIDQLVAVLKRKWEELPQEQINKAIDQFRPRLRKVIEMKGKHIEQFF